MATIKSYTDLEQSHKLAEFLPIESVDMWYDNNGESIAGRPEIRYCSFVGLASKNIPCWSLAALLGVLPDELGDNHFLTLDKEGNEYCCCYEDVNGNSFRHTFADNPVDACYEMILKLNELNLL